MLGESCTTVETTPVNDKYLHNNRISNAKIVLYYDAKTLKFFRLHTGLQFDLLQAVFDDIWTKFPTFLQHKYITKAMLSKTFTDSPMRTKNENCWFVYMYCN